MRSTFGATPERPPGVATLRMNTASSSGRFGMRMRSPSSAPPVSGLCGSHARTATDRPARRITSMSLPISVLFPTPPLPVTAITRG